MRGHFVTKRWTGNPTAQRRGGTYRAFVPEPIENFELSLSGDLADFLEATSVLVRELNAVSTKLASLEAVARQLLCEESLASSRIEGLALGHRRIALADFDLDRNDDRRTADIVGNIRAMAQAVELGAGARSITPTNLRAVHRTLLRFGEDERIAGKWRASQGWIGGIAPTHATYVPPPHEEIPALMEDLCAFVNRRDLPALAQAAIAHAQFENAHPFADGNGRVGRCLIHIVLRRRDVAPTFVPPVSLVLAARRKHYFAGLEDFRGDGLYRWIDFFADATGTAALHASKLVVLIEDLQAQWLGSLARPPRTDAAVRRVIAILPAHPVLDVPVVMRALDVSERAAGGALNELEAAGVVKLVTKRMRGRVWECPALFDAITVFEDGLRTV
jgi:Fic family protein